MGRAITNCPGMLKRLAIVAGHPVQYISPWLSGLADKAGIELKVFYLWDLGVSSAKDPGFGMPLQWDIPLLEGYPYQFIPNRASKPGNRSEERRVGKECRSRWSPYH